ncbi:MAG: GPW/gp25 family protein [Acidobacteriota bacterium]|nr:MAG: GPW/gp25 family protein [Acidobacteriota bacterium]
MNLHGAAIDFPFRTDSRGTCVTTDERPSVIAQAIADIIETRRGERVMLPDYGIRDLVFAVQDASFVQRLAYEIEAQVRRYVPLVRNLSVKAATDEDGRAIVDIGYTEVGEIQAPRNMVYPIWQLVEGV